MNSNNGVDLKNRVNSNNGVERSGGKYPVYSFECENSYPVLMKDRLVVEGTLRLELV